MKSWTRFERMNHLVDADGNRRELEDFEYVYRNSRFQVHATQLPNGLLWLSIKNVDRTARHDWRDLQRVKNEVAGPEREAVELYPAESRLHDTANQFHLWVMPEGERVPFGFDDRYVSEAPPGGGGSQRRFDLKPPDLMTEEQAAAKSPYVRWFDPTGSLGLGKEEESDA